PPQQAWSMEGVGIGYGSMAIVGDRLYTTGYVGKKEMISAVDLASRKVLWKTPVGEAVDMGQPDWYGSRDTPTVDGQRIYAVASEGAAVCLDLATGKVVWRKSFAKEFGSGKQAWGYAESPLIDGDVMICTPGSEKALMVAFDKSTGKELWRTPYGNFGETGKSEAGYSSAIVSNGGGVKQYVQMTGKGAVGVRAKDGKLLWHYNKVANGVAVIPTPLVEGDNVFVSSGYQAGAALLKLGKQGDGVKAEEVYFLDSKDFQNHHGQMILHEGHVYAGRGHGKGFPVCVELKTGEIKWGEGERGPGGGSAAVIFVDGHLIFRYQDGVVALIEATPAAYNLKGTFTPDFTEGPNWAHPVVCDGKLYLRQKGRIMCFDVAAK
ncbi:MAG: PQQ-like beta-propeller repeat protein, partial [Planctomycetota bacterium]|nr:PQQ-like beta-propeller repeat protein [Planctomycetota bacterium]